MPEGNGGRGNLFFWIEAYLLEEQGIKRGARECTSGITFESLSYF